MALLIADSDRLQQEQIQARLAASHAKLAEIDLDRAQAEEAARKLEAEIEAETALLMNNVRTKAKANLAEAIAQPVETDNAEGDEVMATVVESQGEEPEVKAPSDTGSPHEPHTKRRHTGQPLEDDDLMPDELMGQGAANVAATPQEAPAHHPELSSAPLLWSLCRLTVWEP